METVKILNIDNVDYEIKDASARESIELLTENLNAKADASEMETALAEKANASEMEEALAAKANASDMTTKLAAKADKTDLPKFVDTRNENKGPFYYTDNFPFKTVYEFKMSSAIGLSGSGADIYSALITFVDWSDLSGTIYQIAISNNKVWTRLAGDRDHDVWQSWQLISAPKFSLSGTTLTITP